MTLCSWRNTRLASEFDVAPGTTSCSLLFAGVRRGSLLKIKSTAQLYAQVPAYSKKEVSVSGFRATASTLLNEMGRWNPDAIERQPAHMEENDVRRAYMHAAEFWSERVEMMQVRADPLY